MRWARMVVAKVILFSITPAMGQAAGMMPDAPSHSAAMVVHNAPGSAMVTRPPRIVDWSFVAGHAAYAGAAAFDNWETARGLGNCAWEGNPDLGRNPSAKRIAIHGFAEVSAVTAGDYLLKWYGIRHGSPRWLNMLSGELGAGIGTGKHLQGGMQWVRLCKGGGR